MESYECGYCGEEICEGEATWSVPIKEGRDAVGTLCSPECQLAFSRYMVDVHHDRREPLIRAQHKGVTYGYAPPPGFVKRTCIGPDWVPRSAWCQSRKKC